MVSLWRETMSSSVCRCVKRKNREIQQMLVNKIRETDNWNRDNEVEREGFEKAP